MFRIQRAVTKAFVVLSLMLGRVPRAITMLDLLQRPRAAHVIVMRRRPVAYHELFSPRDRQRRVRRPHAPASTTDEQAYVRVPVA